MHKSKCVSFLALFLFFSGLVSANNAPVDTGYVRISKLIITGNNITRLPIINRELIFREGDSIPAVVFERALQRTKENLMNTALFNFVNISHQPTDIGEELVIIDLVERWYIIPVPLFELVDRNFNEFIKSGDGSRVNYGFYLNWDNFRGMNESLRLQFKWGYSQRIGISYTIPYINKNQEEGISFGLNYSRNREVIYGVQDSKPLRLTDKDHFLRREISAGIRYTHREGFYRTNSFSLEFRENRITDTVAYTSPEFMGIGVTRQNLISFGWQYRYDRRDYKIYPLNGYVIDFEAFKYGFGLLKDEPDQMYLGTQARYYQPLAKRWFATGGIKAKLSGQSESSYFNQRGLGYGNEFIRGYEYYIIPGQNYALAKASVKFALIPTQVVSVPFIPIEKFRTIPYALYLNANFDAGFVRDRQFSEMNPLANKWQYGYGLGIDYVTYYSLVLRLEYSINKFGEKGFFLHFTSPI